MSERSEVTTRRRHIAQLLAEGVLASEIAEHLGIRPEVADADVRAIAVDPNNIDYLQPKQALASLLDNLDRLEREAREQLQKAVDGGKPEAANRWFESVRRLTEDRSRVLQQLGLLDRAAEAAPTDGQKSLEELLSPRARKLMARIALAERMGNPWGGDITIEDATALPPIADGGDEETSPPPDVATEPKGRSS